MIRHFRNSISGCEACAELPMITSRSQWPADKTRAWTSMDSVRLKLSYIWSKNVQKSIKTKIRPITFESSQIFQFLSDHSAGWFRQGCRLVFRCEVSWRIYALCEHSHFFSHILTHSHCQSVSCLKCCDCVKLKSARVLLQEIRILSCFRDSTVKPLARVGWTTRIGAPSNAMQAGEHKRIIKKG